MARLRRVLRALASHCPDTGYCQGMGVVAATLLLFCPEVWRSINSNVSLLKGMTEFRVGEVFLICRKIILIHGQGPGFCYFEDNRFK